MKASEGPALADPGGWPAKPAAASSKTKDRGLIAANPNRRQINLARTQEPGIIANYESFQFGPKFRVGTQSSAGGFFRGAGRGGVFRMICGVLAFAGSAAEEEAAAKGTTHEATAP